MNRFLLGTTVMALGLAVATPAAAAEKIKLSLAGYFSGTAYVRSQDGDDDLRGHGFVTESEVHVKGKTTLDNGMEIGFRAEFELEQDNTSGGEAGSDQIDEVNAYIRTAFGQIEFGQQDGAADQLGIFGPRVSRITVDDQDANLYYEDPTTGRRLAREFTTRTDLSLTDDYTKIIYTSPRFAGLQIAFSYTPELTKNISGFATGVNNTPNQQSQFWEVAANYTRQLNSVDFGIYGAYVSGENEAPTAGRDDVYEWGAGGEIGFSMNGGRLSFGAAYRASNAYRFDVSTVYNDGETNVWVLSGMYETGPWLFGVEYMSGDADGPSGVTDYEAKGYQGSVGYILSDGIQITVGVQQVEYRRDIGTFYNGEDEVSGTSGFVNLLLNM